MCSRKIKKNARKFNNIIFLFDDDDERYIYILNGVEFTLSYSILWCRKLSKRDDDDEVIFHFSFL